MKTKEEIYDEEIFPLMGKILEICKENKISMVSSYQLDETDDPLFCTSFLKYEGCTAKIINARNALQKPEFSFFTITTTTSDNV